MRKTLDIEYEGTQFKIRLKPPTRRLLREQQKVLFGGDQAKDIDEVALGVFIEDVDGGSVHDIDPLDQWIIWMAINDFLTRPPITRRISRGNTQKDSDS